MTERVNVGVVVTSTEHGGAEAHIARIWTHPIVAERARGHLLGSLPQWPATGLPTTDIELGAKWSYRRAVRSIVSVPAVAQRGTRLIRAVNAREDFAAFYAHFKREQVVYSRSLARLAPVVWMEHGHFPRGRLRQQLAAAYRFASRAASAIVCLSPSVRDEIASIVGPKGPELVIIENAIDPEWTTPANDSTRTAARRALGVPVEAELVVAVVARLIPRKRIELAIAAATELSDAWVVICGDGPLSDELQALAADNPRIVFTGFRADPREVYAASDVSLLASSEEGFGQVLLEAAAAGLPTVVVADSGIAHSVDGWGEVADAATASSVAAAVMRASRRPASDARRWAEAHNPDDWARKHLAVLEHVIR